MLVRLSDISSKGLEIKDKISLSALNQRMNEGRTNEINFIAEPDCNLKIIKQVNGLALSGMIKTSYTQPCSRCAETLELPLSVPVEVVLKARNSEDPNSIQDDVGIVTYSGEHIDLEPILQEYIILSTSPYLQPEQDVNGKCLLCGKAAKPIGSENSANTIKLGELLAKATKQKK